MLKKTPAKVVRTALVGLPLAASLYSGAAFATMGNLATTYGILPSDIASAQALSMFNDQASAVYYNPAALAKDSRGELTLGLLHADHSLKATSQGGDAPLTRPSNTILDKPSQHLLLGMKTDLSGLSKVDHPLYLGVMIGVEKYGNEMMAFSSGTSAQGQYLEYGRQPLFMNLGFGTKLWRGINAGASLRVTLHAEAKLIATSELDGSSTHEDMDVSAVPSMKPIVGVSMDWGETLCPQGNCWFEGVETALTYRAKSNTHTVVDSIITIDGMLPDPGMNLRILTLDSYQPAITSFGLAYKTDRWRVGASVEHQAWSKLGNDLKKDTLADQAIEPADQREGLKFRDTVIPRIGADYKITEHFSITGGVAFSPTPLKTRDSLDLNLLDGDKTIVGLGITAEYPKTRYLAFPVRFDLAYQYQNINKENYNLFSSRYENGEKPYETVKADGDVHVVAGSMTLKF